MTQKRLGNTGLESSFLTFRLVLGVYFQKILNEIVDRINIFTQNIPFFFQQKIKKFIKFLENVVGVKF